MVNKRFSNIILACAASFLMAASNLGAQALTPEQQNAINSGANNPAAELSQRTREFFQKKAQEEAETSFKNQEEEKAPEAQGQREVPEIKVFLNTLKFTESELIDQATLDEIAAKYQGREIVIADLYKACDEVNAIYAKKGYLASRAMIKAQKIDDGTVVITLVEGKVNETGVKGNKATKARYIERYFDIKQGTYPNFKTIKKHIQTFNNTNSTKLQIKMFPGKAPRTTDIYIVAAEPEKIEKFTFFSDNSGRKNSGEWRYGLNYSNANMCGYCDNFSLAAVFAKTSETAMFNYSIPADDRGNRVIFNYSSNHMRISDGFLKDLDVRGLSEVAGITYSRHLESANNRKLKLNLGFQSQHSTTSIMGRRFVHDDNRRFILSHDNLLIRKTDLFYWRPSFTYTKYTGLADDKTSKKIGIDALYQKFKTNGNSMTLQLNAQKAFEDGISSADRIYIGGFSSVRGYEESLLYGDSGFNLKFDYYWHTKTKGLRLITFADYAKISGEAVRDTNNLYSAGYGFEYRHKDLYLMTTAGYALKRTVNGERVDASKVNMTFNYTF